ncbi:MAG: magnesium transporter [Gallionellaceae bacterium]|nr:MAG: magnesium transporter [Gallionellaceae bacterium]
MADKDGKLVWRVTVNTAADYIREKSENEMLNMVGLGEVENIFASVWKSAKNRWLWLALKLCRAFFTSRMIGGFENTIEKKLSRPLAMGQARPMPSGWSAKNSPSVN